MSPQHAPGYGQMSHERVRRGEHEIQGAEKERREADLQTRSGVKAVLGCDRRGSIE